MKLRITCGLYPVKVRFELFVNSSFAVAKIRKLCVTCGLYPVKVRFPSKESLDDSSIPM